MTDPAAGTPGDQSLQFDHVERAGQTPGLTCSICQRHVSLSQAENGEPVDSIWPKNSIR